MRTEPQRLFLMLISTAMLLAGCTGNQMQNNGATAGPAEDTPPAAPSTISDNTDTTSPDFGSLFDRAPKVDGAYAERLAVDLTNAFDNDSTGFVKALSAYPAEQVDRVTSLLVYGKSYGDIDVFAEEVRQMTNDQLFADDTFVLTSILDFIADTQHSSQTDNKTLDAQYMQGEFWRPTADSADLLPLDMDETPTSYFEQLQSQVTDEAERYIQEVFLPEEENFQTKYGGTKTGDTFYQDSRIDSLEPAGVFCKDGTRYLVYILRYSSQMSTGTRLFIAGCMGLDDDGWMNQGLGHLLVFSLEDDGSIQMCFGCQGTEFAPDGETADLFQQDISMMLGRYLAGERVK